MMVSLILWQNLTSSQETRYRCRTQASETRSLASLSSLAPISSQAMCPSLMPQTQKAPPSSTLCQALQTLLACLMCWTSQLLPITEYKLIQPSVETAENTGGFWGHH